MSLNLRAALASRSIGWRFAAWILLFSSLVTLALTATQFALDYHRDVTTLETRLREIESSHAPIIAKSLWDLSEADVRVQLDSLLHLPELEYAAVINARGEVFAIAGRVTGKRTLQRVFPLAYTKWDKPATLGSLRVVATLDPIVGRLIDRIVIVFFSQLAKTFLVSLFILALFQRLIGRHLDRIADYLTGHGGDLAAPPLKLDRPSPSPPHDDELALVEQAINAGRAQLATTLADLQQHRAHLEDRVAERTAALSLAMQQAAAASQAKSMFLANMSHEIRTPLGAITGIPRLIRRIGVTAEQEHLLGLMQGAADHLLEVINAILDLSKIEAGKLVLDEAPVDVAAIVNGVVTMVIARAQARGLALETCVPALPGGLLGDPTRLRQALLNYATNAIKFTESGAVTLRVSTVAEDNDSTLLRFAVEDTGVGIAPDVLPRLFGAFEQAGANTAGTHGGTGLGLAITRRIAQLMNGKAGADSQPGGGSTFWFTARLKKSPPLPAVADEAPRADAGPILARDHAGARILVVDDEPVNQLIACMLLESVGLVAEVADDGQAACDLASRVHYRAILMDVRMPLLDGLEATRRIRAQGAGSRVPIIAMTANAFTEDRDNCVAAGMDDFLGKPVRPEELYDKLLKWLRAD